MWNYLGSDEQIVIISSLFWERGSLAKSQIDLRSFGHIDLSGNAIDCNSLWSYLMRMELPEGLYHGYPVLDGASSNH